MKKTYLAPVVLSIFVSAHAIAQTNTTNIEGTTAGGQKQTTIVDVNGNLKVIEKDTSNQPSNPSSAPAATNMPNSTSQNNMPSTAMPEPYSTSPSLPTPPPATSPSVPTPPPATSPDMPAPPPAMAPSNPPPATSPSIPTPPPASSPSVPTPPPATSPSETSLPPVVPENISPSNPM